MSKTHKLLRYRGYTVKVKEFSKGYLEWVLVTNDSRVYDPTSYGTASGALLHGRHAVDMIIEHERSLPHLPRTAARAARRSRLQRLTSEHYFRKARS